MDHHHCQTGPGTEMDTECIPIHEQHHCSVSHGFFNAMYEEHHAGIQWSIRERIGPPLIKLIFVSHILRSMLLDIYLGKLCVGE